MLLDLRDPWDFEEVYSVLHDYARGYPFDPDIRRLFYAHHHRYACCADLYVPANGNTVFFLPALQTSPPKRQRIDVSGTYTIIDLDLSKYNQIAARFRREQEERVSFS